MFLANNIKIDFSILDENDYIYLTKQIYITTNTKIVDILSTVNEMMLVKPPYYLESCVWLLTLDKNERIIEKKEFHTYSRRKILSYFNGDKIMLQAHITNGKVTNKCERNFYLNKF